jgi:hypothetical protein
MDNGIGIMTSYIIYSHRYVLDGFLQRGHVIFCVRCWRRHSLQKTCEQSNIAVVCISVKQIGHSMFSEKSFMIQMKK